MRRRCVGRWESCSPSNQVAVTSSPGLITPARSSHIDRHFPHRPPLRIDRHFPQTATSHTNRHFSHRPPLPKPPKQQTSTNADANIDLPRAQQGQARVPASSTMSVAMARVRFAQQQKQSVKQANSRRGWVSRSLLPQSRCLTAGARLPWT